MFNEAAFIVVKILTDYLNFTVIKNIKIPSVDLY